MGVLHGNLILMKIYLTKGLLDLYEDFGLFISNHFMTVTFTLLFVLQGHITIGLPIPDILR
jgi:hypothetical protein